MLKAKFERGSLKSKHRMDRQVEMEQLGLGNLNVNYC